MSDDNNNNTPTLEQRLTELFETTVTELQRRLESGEAKPTDIANAIKLLRDNGITITSRDNDQLSKLEASLPDFDELEWNVQ